MSRAEKKVKVLKTGAIDATAEAEDTSPVAAISDGDSLSQVRDILFGQQIRAFEASRMQMQAHLEGTIEALKQQMRSQFEHINHHISTIVDRLEAESTSRKHQRDQDNERINDHIHSMGQAIDKLRAATQAADAELNGRINRESERLSQDQKAKHEDLKKQFDAAVAELTDNKLDRLSLSSMLSDAAQQLGNSAAQGKIKTDAA